MSPSDLRDKTAQWKTTGSGFPCNYGLALHVGLDRTVILSNDLPMSGRERRKRSDLSGLLYAMFQFRSLVCIQLP